MTGRINQIVDEVLWEVLAEYEQGNPEPLAALVARGAPEVLQNQPCREAIAHAIRTAGKRGKSGPSRRILERNLRLVVFMHVAAAFDIEQQKRIDLASDAFCTSDRNVREVWKKAQCAHVWWLWQQAIEAGTAHRKLHPNEQPSSGELLAVTNKVADLMLQNSDNLIDLRLAAASSKLTTS